MKHQRFFIFHFLWLLDLHFPLSAAFDVSMQSHFPFSLTWIFGARGTRIRQSHCQTRRGMKSRDRVPGSAGVSRCSRGGLITCLDPHQVCSEDSKSSRNTRAHASTLQGVRFLIFCFRPSPNVSFSIPAGGRSFIFHSLIFSYLAPRT